MPLLKRPKPGGKRYVPIAWELKMLLLVAAALGMLFAKELGFWHRGLKVESDKGAEKNEYRRRYEGHKLRPLKRQATSTSSSSTLPTGITTIFQVDPPLLGPQGLILNDGTLNASSITTTQTPTTTASNCTTTLLTHIFANSFGQPFVGPYTPPPCVTTSNTVLLNLTITSNGTQFDRLAHLYLTDTEIWRTSTAEPKRNGIVWTVMMDMSHLLALWKEPQTIVFDLGNQVTANLTGAYDATLTASFFFANGAVNPADVILPISTKMGTNGTGSIFTLPAQNASTAISNFPRNTNRAIVSIAATGQGDEEFWWSNVLESDTTTFNSSASGGLLFGYSPFREVQLLIDGTLAGVVWPFPVIFTGGVVPGLWSPVVGIEAFDLQEGVVDISPFLGLLCDGNSHTLEIRVVGLDDDGKTGATLSEKVGGNWVVSGKVFIWLDTDGSSITTGQAPSISAPSPQIAVTQLLGLNSTGGNDTLSYTTNIKRDVSISSTITTQNGAMAMNWIQTLTHTDNGVLFNQGNGQTNIISTQGKDTFQLGMDNPYQLTYSYPLFANSSVTPLTNTNGSSGIRIDATISRTKSLTLHGKAVFPTGLQAFANLPLTEGLAMTLQGTTVLVQQNGTAGFMEVTGGNNTNLGGTGEVMIRVGGMSPQGMLGMQEDLELWFRDVKVRNGSVVGDEVRLVGYDLSQFESLEDGGKVLDAGDDAGLGRIPLVRTGVGD